MARKRKVDPEEALYWQRYYSSPTIEYIYPGVAIITINMIFRDDSHNRVIDTSTDKYLPSQKAFFRIKCHQRECVNGGFDLSSTVSSAVHSDEGRSKGRIICQGWQDRERIGNYHCLWELEYDIIVDYK